MVSPPSPGLMRTVLALNLRQQVEESAPQPPENAAALQQHVQAHQRVQAALLSDKPWALPVMTAAPLSADHAALQAATYAAVALADPWGLPGRKLNQCRGRRMRRQQRLRARW